MNKYNPERRGFEVSREGGRRAVRCDRAAEGIRPAHPNAEPKGSYGETLNRLGMGGACGAQLAGGYGIKDRPVGSVYAPLQNFEALYEPEWALMRGTLFSSLDLPLEAAPRGGGCRG